MRLEGSFYEPVSTTQTAAGYDIEVELREDHSIYEGHFPGQPVVPGVCTLTIIREQLSRLLGKPLMFATIKEVKYIGMIVPEAGLRVNFSLTIEGDSVRCVASRKDEPVLKLSATIREQKASWAERLKAMGCLVVIPTYNNEKTIVQVVSDVKQYADDILVVNDGCTDSTHELIAAIEGIQRLEYEKNAGKGVALKRAIRYALDHGYKYMLTIDSDGQHYADDIPAFIEAEEAEPGTLLVGARNLNAENMPGKNSFANKFSNFWFKVDTAKTLSDTQSGYRLYPLEKLRKTRFVTGRYEFEVEILVRSAWKGIPVKNIPIKVYYAPEGERVSHFKPARDFLRISILNTGLFLAAILFYYPWLCLRYFLKGDWAEVKNILKASKEKPFKLAASLGLGVFCGILPVWGGQIFIAAGLAYLLKLNKIFAMAATNISIPPMIPVIIYGSYKIGAMLVETNKVFQYIVGALILAVAAGLAVTLVSWLILGFINLFRKKEKAND